MTDYIYASVVHNDYQYVGERVLAAIDPASATTHVVMKPLFYKEPGWDSWLPFNGGGIEYRIFRISRVKNVKMTDDGALPTGFVWLD